MTEFVSTHSPILKCLKYLELNYSMKRMWNIPLLTSSSQRINNHQLMFLNPVNRSIEFDQTGGWIKWNQSLRGWSIFIIPLVKLIWMNQIILFIFSRYFVESNPYQNFSNIKTEQFQTRNRNRNSKVAHYWNSFRLCFDYLLINSSQLSSSHSHYLRSNFSYRTCSWIAAEAGWFAFEESPIELTLINLSLFYSINCLLLMKIFLMKHFNSFNAKE